MPEENNNEETPYRDAGSEKLAASIASLIDKKGGDQVAVIRTLMDENVDYRAKLREKNRELDALRKQTKDAVILTGDEAKRWQAFEKLGLKPEEIAPQIERGKAAETEAAELKAKDADRAVAESMGWKAGVWTDQRKLRNLTVEMRDVTVEENGQQVTKKVPHVRTAGDEKAEWQPLEKYAEANLGDYLPSLTADTNGSNSGPNGNAPKQQQQSTQQWPRQTGTERKAGPKSADEIAKEKAKSGLYTSLV